LKVITRVNTNEIVIVSSKADIVSNGILTDTCVVGIAVDEDGSFSEAIPKIYDVEVVPENVEPRIYAYTPEKGFYLIQSVVDVIKEEAQNELLDDLIQRGVL